MQFNKHSELEGQHAFLSASKYHWVNYSLDQLQAAWASYWAKERGTRLHAFAREAIELGIPLPTSGASLNAYINDAIDFGMTPEQGLRYSANCFGTADAISYNERKKILRIHDLKTGATPASMMQLRIYQALFCLEYGLQPERMHSELRIYQNDDIQGEEADPQEIRFIMDKIREFDPAIEKMKKGQAV